MKTALEMLDAEGLENITLRRLAARLGVQAPALYWHFKNKQDILDEMAQAILSSPPLARLELPEDAVEWINWLRRMAHALRAALLARREGARVVAGASLGRARALAELAERTMHVLHMAGFAPLAANLATTTIIGYTFGFVIEEQAGQPDTVSPKDLEQLAIEFPLMAAVIKVQGTITDDERFDWGIQVILTGLETRVQSPTA